MPVLCAAYRFCCIGRCVIELTFDSRFNLPGKLLISAPDAPLFLVLPLPAGKHCSLSPLPPFSVHSYQSLATENIICLCGSFCCSGFFSCSFAAAAFLSAAAFSAAAFLSLLPFQQPLFLLLFCRLPLSLCRFLCCRFLLSFCLGFFSSSVAAFFLASAAAASAASAFFSAPPQQPRLFSALRLRLWRLCFCFFLRVCRRFLRCFFRSLASASAFALASAAAFAAASSLASALTRPVLRLLQPAFSAPSR